MARPLAELVLSDDERQTLTTWASRPKSTLRLATRARIVLACAEGLENNQVAAKLRVCAATGGPSPTPTSSGSSPGRWRPSRRTPPAGAPAAWPAPPACPRRRRPHLALVGPEAPPPRDVQALHRPVLRREGPRRRGPLPQPAGAGDRPVSRREEPGAGPGPHAAPAADDAGAARAADARLRPPRDDVAVRGPERRHRRGHREVPPPPSPPGVLAVPQRPSAWRGIACSRRRPGR